MYDLKVTAFYTCLAEHYSQSNWVKSSDCSLIDRDFSRTNLDIIQLMYGHN